MLIAERSERLTELSREVTASFIIAGFLVCIVQVFFCLRVWKVSGKNRVLAAVIAISSAMTFAAGLAVNIIQFKNPTSYPLQPLCRCALVGAMVCDATICGSMVYFFRSYRVGQPRTEPVLQQLIILFVNMGVILCICAAATLILYETKRGTGASLTSVFISSKLYINSMMATLNVRKHLRKVANRSMTYSLPTIMTTSSSGLHYVA